MYVGLPMASAHPVVITVEQLEKFKTAIKGIVRNNYDHLGTVLGSSQVLNNFVTHLVPTKILTDAVARHPTYADIISDFEANFPYLRIVGDVETHCRNFVCALSEVGGGASTAAGKLKKEWREAAVRIGCQDFLIEACK